MVNLGDLVYNIIANDKASATTANAAKAIGGSAIAIGGAITATSAAVVLLLDDAKKGGAANAAMALTFNEPTEAIKTLTRSLQSVHTPIADVKGALDELARAGMKLEDAGKSAAAFDKLGEATGKTATEITTAMIPAFNALGIPLTKAPDQIDGLAAMLRKSNVDLEDFSTLMTRVGPDLGSMGLGLSDVEAILMSFADRGITGRKATTELSTAIRAADGDIGALYKSLGITTDQLAEYKTKIDDNTGAAQKFADAQNKQYGTMDQIGYQLTLLKQKATDGLAPFEGLATAGLGVGTAIATLGGVIETVVGAGGLSGIAAAASALVLPLAAVVGSVALVAGGFYGMYTQSEKFRTMIGSIIDGAVSLGKAFIQWVTPIKDAIIAALLPALKQTGDFFSGQFAKITTWLGGEGKSFIKFLGDMAVTLKGAILEGIKQFGKVWDQYLRPAFEGAVGGAIDEVLKALKGVGDWFADPKTQNGIKDLCIWLGKLVEAAAPVLIQLGTAFVEVMKASAATIGWYQGILQKFSDWVLSIFGPAIKTGIEILGTVWETVKGPIKLAWDWITKTIGEAWKGIVALFTGEGANPLVTAVGNIWTSITSAIPTAWSLISGAIVLAVDNVKTNFVNALAFWIAAAAYIWTTIQGAIQPAWDLIWGALSGAVETVKTNFTTSLATVTATVGQIWTDIQSAVAPAWVLITSAITGAIGLLSAAVDIALAPIRAAMDFVNGVGSAVQNVVNLLPAQQQTTAPVAGPSTTVAGQYPVSTGDTVYDKALGMYVPTMAYTSHHSGGVFEAPGGGREGLALLLSGERVLSPSQTSEYDSGLMAVMKDIQSMLKAGGLGGGQNKDIRVTVESDIPLTVKKIDQYNSSRAYAAGYRSV